VAPSEDGNGFGGDGGGGGGGGIGVHDWLVGGWGGLLGGDTEAKPEFPAPDEPYSSHAPP
jgi:hypothetical protein